MSYAFRTHRVDRVPGFPSSRPNRVRSPPHPQASVAPLWFVGGGDTLAGEGVGGPHSDEGTDTVVLYCRYSKTPLQLGLSSKPAIAKNIFQKGNAPSRQQECQFFPYFYFCCALVQLSLATSRWDGGSTEAKGRRELA
jgi:hypothetical protein